MIEKSKGATPSEQFLAELCENTFLKAWSFPNPYNQNKKEFCDLIAVFDNNMFIFFDRTRKFQTSESKEISWERWKREVIEKQIKTSIGAEKYIRKNGNLYLDVNLNQKFPIPYDPSSVKIFKIIIAHGAEEACKLDSKFNFNGSLGIIYTDKNEVIQNPFPFTLRLDKNNPVHILDTFNLPIILSELDTFYDLSNYLIAKESAISKFNCLSYCGEEDLLTNYLSNYNSEQRKHFIGSMSEQFDSLMLLEGHWLDFTKTQVYQRKIKSKEISYIWDTFIQRSSNYALLGTLEGNSNLFTGESAIYEMAKEPRFFRKALSEKIVDSIKKFPISNHQLVRHITLMPSFFENKAYIFLQVSVKMKNQNYKDYRNIRQHMLQIACGVAKNKYPNLETIIGIATEPPILYEKITEDFILLNCKEWSNTESEYYERENIETQLNFFNTSKLNETHTTIKEFPD